MSGARTSPQDAPLVPAVSTGDPEARCAALRERLSGAADVFLATTPANVRYLTGFDGVFDEEPAHVALIDQGTRRLLTDSRYFEAASTAAHGGDWRVELAQGDVLLHAANVLNAESCESLGFETTLSFDRHAALVKAFAGVCSPAKGWVEDLRAVKDAEEISRIRAAQALTDVAFDHILGFVREGATELEIALELEFFMRREGSEGVAFAPIVASGPNSALPHAIVGPRALAKGDFVVLDFGARLGGYCADMTRTVVIGQAGDEQRSIYDTVRRANEAGAAAVAAGKPGCEIDAAARAVIDDAGFGEFFGHGLGHGVGLEVHEQPGLGARSTAPVPLGSVVTIEPGIYIPGMGGVRIEDLAVVEESGARILTHSTKDLIEL